MSELVDAPVRAAYRAAHLALRAYWRIRRPATRGALVALWFDGEILLVRSSYRATYSLPGGYVKRGEDPRRAARREVVEELGLELRDDQLRHAWAGSFPFEHRTDSLDIFEVELEAPFHLEPDGRELVWAGWKTPDEVLSLDIVPHLRDYLDRRALEERRDDSERRDRSDRRPR